MFFSKTKRRLQQNIKGIKDFKATDIPKKVILVNKEFHDDLVNWLTHKTVKIPENLNTELFFVENKFDSDLKRGVDYEIISNNLWNDLITQFGSHPKIEAILIKNPKNGKETILLQQRNCLEFNIYLPKKVSSTDTYSISMKPIQYYSDPSWLLEDVKKQICSNYGLDSTLFSISIHNQKVNFYQIINEKLSMNQVSKNYKNELDIRQNKLNQNKDTNINISENRNSLRMHKNPRNSEPNPSTFSIDLNPYLVGFLASYNEMIRRTSPLPKLIGLNNIGNTCYFNASIQCLVRVVPLTQFILSDSFTSQVNPLNPKSSGGLIANSYRTLLVSLCNGSTSIPQNPKDFRTAFVSKFRQFANFNQHDSQEFLCALLDGLHEDMNQSPFARGHSNPHEINPDSDSWDLHLSRNCSPIVDIFHGILYSSIICPSCGFIEKVREPFEFLSLEVPRRFGSVSLISCLNKFSRKESLSFFNKWHCERCKKMVCATKEIGVEKCGKKALIIHLKRFSGEGLFSSKIETTIDYPDVLDTSEFTKSDNGRFRLIGAVLHRGGLGYGHYTAAAIDPLSNEWYYFNDSTVRKIDQNEAHSRNAYILFYERME